MSMKALPLAAVMLISPTDMGRAQPKAVPDFSGTWTRTWATASLYDGPPSGPGPVMMDPARPMRLLFTAMSPGSSTVASLERGHHPPPGPAWGAVAGTRLSRSPSREAWAGGVA